MYLTEPGPSHLDLHFRLGGVSVRITPWFWVVHGGIGVLLASMGGVSFLFFWVGALLLSLLVHEFGHVLVGKAFGSSGRIVLTPFFGLALECADLDERRQRVLVFAAGPAAQLLLAGILWPVDANLDWPKFSELSSASSEEEVKQSLEDLEDLEGVHTRLKYLTMVAGLLHMNWLMPLVSLLPVPPLVGWHICRELQGGRYGGRAPWEQNPD
jgi:hypothetical protein